MGLLTACYEDDSNVGIKEINPLVIDLGGSPNAMSVYLLDTLEIAPIVYKIGVSDADLSYRWELSGNDIVPRVLDTTMILKAVIGVPANSEAYSLLLTVTDNTTSLQNYEEFKITVSAKLGQGLLVADTKDGQHTDLNLIVSGNFRGSIWFNQFNEKNAITMTSVFSQCNDGLLIDGLVTQMLAPGEGRQSERTLTLITDHNAYRMDPYDYLLSGTNNDFFYVHVPAARYQPELMTYDNSMYFETMILDGVVYSRDTRWGNLNYGAPLETSDYSDYEVHMGCGFAYSVYPDSHLYTYYYDELNDRFLESDPTYTQLVVNSKMNLNLGKQKALFMGEGEKGLMYTVFQSQNGNDYMLYTFQPGSQLGKEYEARERYNLSACPDIRNARYFEASRNEKVLYYATDKKIYAALLTSETPEAHECFQVDGAGETITSLLLWKVSNQGVITIKDEYSGGEPTKVLAQYRMMVIALWNETEQQGKVITVPIMNLGAGVLEKNREYRKEYTGFGKILCIAPQLW